MSMQSGRPPSCENDEPIGRHELIGSDRVEGTNVYRSDGKQSRSSA